MAIPNRDPFTHPLRMQDRCKVEVADILPRHTFSRYRSEWLPIVRHYLRKRRVRIGQNATLLFENAITVRHQVQEVLFWETPSEEAASARQHEELDIYRTLLPAPTALAATLLVDGGSRDTGLAIGQAFSSGQPCIGLLVGKLSVPARLAETDPDLTEPVKFLRFDLTPKVRRAILSGAPMQSWFTDRGAYTTQALHPETSASLANDISEAPCDSRQAASCQQPLDSPVPA